MNVSTRSQFKHNSKFRSSPFRGPPERSQFREYTRIRVIPLLGKSRVYRYRHYHLQTRVIPLWGTCRTQPISWVGICIQDKHTLQISSTPNISRDFTGGCFQAVTYYFLWASNGFSPKPLVCQSGTTQIFRCNKNGDQNFDCYVRLFFGRWTVLQQGLLPVHVG